MKATTVQMVRLEKLSEIVDEEVILRIGDCELVCFAGGRLRNLVEGVSYPVKLSLLILNDYHVEEIEDESEQSVIRQGSAYSYKIKGRLFEGRLHACGFVFEDGAFDSDYGYLEGKMISMDVDRIDAQFLPIKALA